MKGRFLLLLAFCFIYQQSFCWGFFAHRKINQYAVFLLPPEMLILFRTHADFLSEHAVDPDKRRYAVPYEASRHFIDIDHYGEYPYTSLPRKWNDAVQKFSEDTLQKYGVVPWWIQSMLSQLTEAFRLKQKARILKLAAEIGHYIGDAHVPLHASSNHNGQLTDQKGIHGFWESRIPELICERQWDFFIGKASYISNPGEYMWQRVLESAAASDTVLRYEKELSLQFPPDRKYSFEERNGIIIKQYSTDYSIAYDKKLGGMIERRMRQSVYSIASFWYTAWINAGQPELTKLNNLEFGPEELKEFETLSKITEEHY